jgi:hypothetical protein
MGKYGASPQENQEFVRRIEHEPYFGSVSQAEIGRKLGSLALVVEETRRAPGMGLIFIREVSTGKKINEVLEDFENRTYPKEIAEILNRNPSLMHIAQTVHTSMRAEKQRATAAIRSQKRIADREQRRLEKFLRGVRWHYTMPAYG